MKTKLHQSKDTLGLGVSSKLFIQITLIKKGVIKTIEVTFIFTFKITPLTFHFCILRLPISDRLCNIGDIRGRQVLTE